MNELAQLIEESATRLFEDYIKDNMSQEEINSLIAINPTAVFRMLGVDTNTKPIINTDTGDVNSQNFQEKAPNAVPSSMGYISSKQLESNWIESKKRTNEKNGFN